VSLTHAHPETGLERVTETRIVVQPHLAFELDRLAMAQE